MFDHKKKRNVDIPSHRTDQRLTPPRLEERGGGGEGVGGGGEEVTWTTAAQQLIERPLGG